MINLNKRINSVFFIVLIISLIFIIPFNISFATDSNVFEKGFEQNMQRQGVENFCGQNSGLNVKNSLLMSIVTLCLPGILDKVYEWHNLKCEEVVCYYNAVKNGLDPTFCVKEEQYMTCKYIIGEIFAFPPLTFFTYFKNLIRDLIANPIGAAFGAAVIAARSYLKSCACGSGVGTCSSTTTGALVLSLTAVDLMSLAQRIKDLLRNGVLKDKTQKNYCKQMKDIEKDMQNIINADKS